MSEEQKNNQAAPEAAPTTPQPPVGGPTPAPQPPVGQTPPTPPGYAAQPMPTAGPAPLTQLSGGMKFGWLVVGMCMGLIGILLAWLVNVDKMPQVKSDAIKFSIIGLAIGIVLWFVLSLVIGGLMAAMFANLMDPYGYGSYGTYGTYGSF